VNIFFLSHSQVTMVQMVPVVRMAVLVSFRFVQYLIYVSFSFSGHRGTNGSNGSSSTIEYRLVDPATGIAVESSSHLFNLRIVSYKLADGGMH
jgi:hypothetical protein